MPAHMDAQTTDRRETMVAAAGLLGLVIAYLLLAIAGQPGNTLGWQFGDTPAAHLIWREWGFGWMARGVFPMWNPHVFCGLPFAANPETSLFYPLNWPIFLALPAHVGINVGVVLHLWLGGFGCWMMARGTGLRGVERWVVAIGWMFSAQILGRLYAGHQNILMTAAWVPWAALGIGRIFQAAHPSAVAKGMVLAAAAVGMMGLSGHPQILHHALLLLAVYTTMQVLTCWRADRDVPRVLAQGAATLGAVMLGLMGSAVQVLVTALAAQESSRLELTREAAATFDLPLRNAVTLLVPNFFGDGETSPWWGPWYRWETAISVGMTGLVLMIFASAYSVIPPSSPGQRQLRRGIRAALVPLVFALVFALGERTPLFGLIRTFVPGMDLFRGPTKMLVPAVPFAALLMGFGFSLLAHDWRRVLIIGNGLPSFIADWRKTMLFVAPLVVLLAVVFPWSISLRNTDVYTGLVAEYLERGAAVDFDPAVITQTPVRQAATAHAIRSTVHAVPVALFTACFLSLAISRPRTASRVLLVGWMAIELWISHRFLIRMFDATHRPVIMQAQPGIPQYGRVLVADPRVSPSVALREGFLAVNGYESLQPRRIMRLMNAINGQPEDSYDPLPQPRRFDSNLFLNTSTTYILNESGIGQVEGWRPRVQLVSESDAATTYPVSIVSDKPNRLEVRVQPGSPARLYVSDTWARGWTAMVDGAEAPIGEWNIAFRSLEVPAAAQSVVFRYRAPGLVPGLIISLMAWVGMVVLAAWARGRGSRESSV